jgi:signal transduction histidine kinase
MTAPKPKLPSWLSSLWVKALVVWTLLSLLQTLQYLVVHDPDNPALSWQRALGLGFGLWYTWGLLWLLVYPLARRFSLGSSHWPSRLALHLAACAVFASVKIFLDYPVIKSFYCPTPEKLTLPVFLQDAFTGMFLRYVLFYWTMIGVSHALEYHGKFRERELHAAQLENGLARARLQLLKAQLHPHFLFNTLNAISALVHVDVEAADRMLAQLGDLLRLALEDFGVQEAPLARELEIVRAYLEIEQARLGSRLRVCWDIGVDTTDAHVPTFLLQPLVENAIRHGIAPRAAPGRIEVRARRRLDVLVLQVSDDGPGFPNHPAECGVGLANTRARLLHLYGAEQRLETGNHPRGGGVVSVTLPFHERPHVTSGDTKEHHDTHVDCG